MASSVSPRVPGLQRKSGPTLRSASQDPQHAGPVSPGSERQPARRGSGVDLASASPTSMGGKPTGSQAASRPRTPASPQIRAHRLSWRWARQNWKLLVVGFLVVYQVLGLVWIQGDDHRGDIEFIQHHVKTGDDAVLSAPVAPDFPDLPAWRLAGGVKDEAEGARAAERTESGAAGTHLATDAPAEHAQPEQRLGVTSDATAQGGGAPEADASHGEDRHTSGDATRQEHAAGGAGGVASSAALLERLRAEEVQTRCSPIAVLFGYLGATLGLGLSCLGAGSGISRAGKGMAHLGLGHFYAEKKSQVLRGMIPVIMAELLSIYGLITGVTITLQVSTLKASYPLSAGFFHLGAGLVVGASCLMAGHTIGIIGDVCNRMLIETPAVFAPMILLLIFAEALALYGLICSLLMGGTARDIATAHACVHHR